MEATVVALRSPSEARRLRAVRVTARYEQETPVRFGTRAYVERTCPMTKAFRGPEFLSASPRLPSRERRCRLPARACRVRHLRGFQTARSDSPCSRLGCHTPWLPPAPPETLPMPRRGRPPAARAMYDGGLSTNPGMLTCSLRPRLATSRCRRSRSVPSPSITRLVRCCVRSFANAAINVGKSFWGVNRPTPRTTGGLSISNHGWWGACSESLMSESETIRIVNHGNALPRQTRDFR